MKRFRVYEQRQEFLLPPSLRDWLPEGHLAHFINEVVDQLNLSVIYRDYQELRGQPPYDPRMMVKLWLYAYCRGVRSSRKVERALVEDIAFRFLAANQHPDFWTLNAFRTRHHNALGELFVQTVHLAAKAGLVKLGHVAVDGTKLKANASKHSAMSYGRMVEEEQRLREEIEPYLRECDEVDRQEDVEFGPDRRGDELPEHLQTQKQRLEAIRKAMAELEAEAEETAKSEEEERRRKAEAKGRPHRPRKREGPVKPPPTAQWNFTDPESRIMRSADKSFIQGYNAQLAVDAETQVVVAADLTNQAADCPHLTPILDQVQANTGRIPKEVSADTGYFSEENMKDIANRGSEAFIPPEKVKHSQWRQAKPPRGRIPKNASPKDLMRRKLRTKRGRERYKLRQVSVEPVIGQIKEGRGLRQVLHRGVEKARALWRFDAAAHNVLKMYRAGVQFGVEA
jgi:transposase/Sec-independent protein translocase protein TatA